MPKPMQDAVAVLDGEIVTDETIQVSIAPHPFQARVKIEHVPSGLSCSEIVDRLWTGTGSCLVRADGVDVDFDRRDAVRPRATAEIVGIPGEAAKKVIKVVAAVVVAVVAVAAAVVLGPIVGPVVGLSPSLAGALLGTVVSAIGSLALAALFPPTQPQLAFSPIGSINAGGLNAGGALAAGSASRSSSSGVEGSPTFSIGGARNEFAPFGVVNSVLGRHRVSPPYAAQVSTEVIGNQQYVRAILCWGHGDMTVSDLKIGETDIELYSNVEIDTQTNWEGDIAPGIFPAQFFQEDLNVTMLPNVVNTRTTPDDTDEITLDFAVPGGLYRFQKSTGNRIPRTVAWQSDYRLSSGGDWTTWLTTNLSESSTTGVRQSHRLGVTRGKYDIRVYRTTETYTGEDIVADTLVWTAMKSQRNNAPISVNYPLAITSVRIQATSQLSGVIETLNGICVSKVKSWSGSEWVANQESSNPADLFRHVLQGPANLRPVPDAEIDLDALADWADYCASNGYTFNQVRDFKDSVYNCLRDIAAAGRAVPTFVDGKWSVTYDDPNGAIVQHFTPANSSEFAGSRAFLEMPHAFRARFVNADKNYQQDELIIYDDGYDAENATLFEAIEFPGVTDADLVWKHGRYQLAQLRLRRETYVLTTDFEHLICTRGDRVRVTHDVPQWGLGFGRVKAIAGEVVKLQGQVSMLPGGAYSMRFRLADGTSSVRTLITEAGTHSQVTMVADAGETAPDAGDIYQFGETGSESVVLRVLAIRPGPDFSAKLTLVDEAPAIYDADTGTIPAFETQISEPINYFDLPPTGLSANESFEQTQGGLVSVANLSWAPPVGPVTGYLLEYKAASASEWSDTLTIASPETSTQVKNLLAGSYLFRLKAVFGTLISNWSNEVALEAGGALTVPDDVTGFRAMVSGSSLILSWMAVNDVAVRGYEIRFTKALSGATWPSSATAIANAQGTSAVLPFAKGTYLIKAVTSNGVASASAALNVVNVEPLSAINVVEVATDNPEFAGAHDRTYFDENEGAVILDNAQTFFTGGQFFSGSKFFSGTPGREPIGYYTLADVVDLGAVMTARLSSDITVGGLKLNSKFFTGGPFFTGSRFFSADPDQWDLTTEVRTTDDDPGLSPIWSDWSEFLAADYSARGFEFRLKLESTSALVTPLLTAASFTVDMPDRILAAGDVQSTSSGLVVTFSPAFRSVKAVNITPQNLSTGDYFTVTHNDSQFEIHIYNSSGLEIDRSFDYQVVGYGSVIS